MNQNRVIADCGDTDEAKECLMDLVTSGYVKGAVLHEKDAELIRQLESRHIKVFMGSKAPVSSKEGILRKEYVNPPYEEIGNFITESDIKEYVCFGALTDAAVLAVSVSGTADSVRWVFFDQDVEKDPYAAKILLSVYAKAGRIMFYKETYGAYKSYLENPEEYFAQNSHTDVELGSEYTFGKPVIDLRGGWAKDLRKGKPETWAVIKRR